MTELSPAALSILQAFDAAIDDGVRVGSERRGIAAALRALAENSAGSVFACHEPVVLASRILTIATELENHE